MQGETYWLNRYIEEEVHINEKTENWLWKRHESAKMMKGQEVQTSENPQVSPNTARRKHDFRLTRLQSEVMTRARSTLSGIGDVWKARVNGVPQTPTSTSPSSNQSTPPRSPKSQSAVKNTFEFFWPKGRKDSVKEKGGSSKKDSKRKTSDERQSRTSKRGENRRFSRNQSVDISEIQNRRRSAAEEFSRSMDDGIHYLSDDDDEDSDRPKSYNDTFDFLRGYDDYTRNYYDSRKKEPRHILFNDEDDVIFYKTSPSPGKISAVVPLKIPPTPPGGILSRNSKNGTIPRTANDDLSSSSKKPESKVISARLKIQPPDDGRPQQRYNSMEQKQQGSAGGASRAISTVIIEEQEQHDELLLQSRESERRRKLSKQPSFDQHDFKSDTLPRVRNKRLTALEAEERIHRSGSLDLELEVHLI